MVRVTGSDSWMQSEPDSCLLSLVRHVGALGVVVTHQMGAEILVEHFIEVGLKVAVTVWLTWHQHEVKPFVCSNESVDQSVGAGVMDVVIHVPVNQ